MSRVKELARIIAYRKIKTRDKIEEFSKEIFIFAYVKKKALNINIRVRFIEKNIALFIYKS